MSGELTVAVEVEAYCSCGEELNVTDTGDRRTAFGTVHNVTVEPCRKCLDRAFEDGEAP